MKKLLAICMALIAITPVVGKEKMSLHGECKGCADGTKLYLSVATDKFGKEFKNIDSTIVEGGVFAFKLKNVEPNQYVLRNDRLKLNLFVDYGNSVVVINEKYPKGKVFGNSTDSLIILYNNANIGAIMAQMGIAFKNKGYMDKGQQMPDSLLKEMVANYETLTANAEKITKEIASRADMASAYVLMDHGSDKFKCEELDEIYARMPKNIKSSPCGIQFKTKLDTRKRLEIGVVAPNFKLKTPEGNVVELLKFVAGKKLVLIDFWASWCGPCRAENPNVLAIYNDYKDKGFDVISVSLDENHDKWVNAIKADKLVWTHVSDLLGWKAAPAQLYNVKGIPSTFLLDGSGHIIAKNLRGEELRAKVVEFCK